MPKVKKAPRPAVAAAPETEPPTPTPPAPAGDDLALDDRDLLPFFDYMARLTEREWEDRMVYLYRQGPAVQNKGATKYLEKISHGFDEEYVKQNHGGGKYLAVMKNQATDARERSHSFEIGGQPKFLEGQVLVNPPPQTPATAVAAPQEAGLVEVLKQVLARLQEKNPSQEEAIKVAFATIGQAYQLSLDTLGSTAKLHAASPTGSPIADQLLTAFIGKMKENPEKTASFTERLAETRELLKLLRPEEPPAQQDPMEMLTKIKDVFGLDFKDAAARGGGGPGDWRNMLAAAGVELLSKAPTMFREWSQLRQKEIEVAGLNAQARLLHVQHGGSFGPSALGVNRQPGPGPTPGARPFIVGSPAPASAAAAGPGSPLPVSFAPTEPEVVPPTAGESAFDPILRLIANCYVEGDGGDAAALVVRRAAPNIAASFVPFLRNFAQVKLFALQNPILVEIAQDADFDDFMKEFIQEMTAPGSAAIVDVVPSGPSVAPSP